MRIQRLSAWGVFVAVLLGATSATAQGVYISEFMASNQSTLRDEDGEFSDWLELYNDNDESVNLNGFYLTDDRLELNKWRIPNITIPSKGFRIVFCSDKDRISPSSELHTNYKLSSVGEYLALIAADGETVVHEYDVYPTQVADFSYGLSQNGQFLQFLDESSAARAFVPANDNLGDTWKEPNFNDNAWKGGTQGIGYDYDPLVGLDVDDEMNDQNESIYIRLEFDVEDAAGVTSFLLRMKYDDGFAAFLNGTPVARANSPSVSPDWDDGATQNHDDGDAVEFVDFAFVEDVLVDGQNVLAVHGLNNGLGSSDFLISCELSASSSGELDPGLVLYFDTPTPGAGNVQGFLGISETPQISADSSVFVSSTTVDLSVDAPNAVIRYTTDGSEPRATSTIANGSITINSSVQLKARSFEDGKSPSPTASLGFLRVDSGVRNATSNIPILVIENFGRGDPGTSSHQAGFAALYEPVGGTTRLTTPPTFQSRVGLKRRGSSTAGQPKRQYSMEVWDENSEDMAVSLLGMPKESDWVLYGGNGFDHAMIRNAFMFRLSRDVGAYASRTQFCEVYFNQNGGSVGTNDYVGVYAITEKIKRDNNRVDVERLSASDTTEPRITGGYMFKIDRLDPGDGGFRGGGRTLGWVYPKEDFATSAQRSWISGHIDQFISVLNSANFRHPTAGYRAFIDEEQWVAHHILNVLAMNVDALRLSTYFSKGREDLLVAGPIWDFDRSMGSSDGRDDNTNAWNGTGDGTRFFSYPWWDRLFDDLDFHQLWVDRWQQWRRAEMSDTTIVGIITFYEQILAQAGARNHSRWGWGNFRSDIATMRNWVGARLSWIDSQLVAAPRLSRTSRAIDPGFELGVTGGEGSVYYTLDGTDPRLPGGGLNPDAERYSGGIQLEENAMVVARSRSGNVGNGDGPRTNWSSPAIGSYWTRLPKLVISELMYHPPDPLGVSPYAADDFEFIELFNAENQPIELENFSFTGGIDFVFEGGTLSPGEYVVVVRNLAAFESRYGAGVRVAGEYRDNFANGGETIVLEGPLGEPIHSITYSDLWLPPTDGQGFSMVAIDVFDDLESWESEDGWIESSVVFGTPGEDDPDIGDLGGRQLPGDSNQDGRLDLSDPLHLLRRLFVGGIALPCDGGIESASHLALLDVSGDDGVDMTDAIYLVNYLFKSGPAPTGGQFCIRIQDCPTITCGL